jgi:putative transposase
VANPAVLTQHLRHLRKLDRAIARCKRGSRNRTRLLKRRARLHGTITKTRALELQVIGIEDLNLAGMGARQGRLGRSVADTSLGELRRRLTYKMTDRGATLVPVDRFYPSSKTCSSCGSVKAKLDRGARTFECEHCGAVLDRDVNAARNISYEAVRILGQAAESRDRPVAGLRPETQNADPRARKARGAHAPRATAA